ncbi:MAG: tetratricopeptide repeat protein [Gammaproteobacteria bacterium]
MTNDTPSNSASTLEQLLQDAKLLENKRDFEAAHSCYVNILKQYPNDPVACYEFGVFLNHIGHYNLAKNYLAAVLKIQPNHADAWLALGVSLQELKVDKESEKCYRLALSLNPNLAAAYANLGILHRRQGLYQEAIQYYQKALALDPGLAGILVALGLAYSLIGDNEQALITLKKAILVTPNNAKAYGSLGQVLQLTHHYDEALLCYQKALSIDPDNNETRFNLGFYYLQQGDFKQGLPLYEARWLLPTANPVRSQFIYPRWQGESLHEKTLLIFTEQGYGDTINFCRYIPLIDKGNGKIILNCVADLVPLMKTLPGIDQIIIRDQPNPTVDYYIPLQSLPLIFNTTLETIPAQIPYLKTDPATAAYWQDYFSVEPDKLKVGICWRGRRNLVNSINRTCGLNYFLPLMELENSVFYSLQKDILPEEKTASTKMVILADQMQNFSDTAAIIEQLDLVITIDTAVAHLAGALNKPVWNLLPYFADWRWLLDRSDTPWYPSMRLYRQSVANEWDSVFTQVWNDLQQV